MISKCVWSHNRYVLQVFLYDSTLTRTRSVSSSLCWSLLKNSCLSPPSHNSFVPTPPSDMWTLQPLKNLSYLIDPYALLKKFSVILFPPSHKLIPAIPSDIHNVINCYTSLIYMSLKKTSSAVIFPSCHQLIPTTIPLPMALASNMSTCLWDRHLSFGASKNWPFVWALFSKDRQLRKSS